MEELLGGTRINYLGHSAFRFVTAGGEQILVDPFLTDNPTTPQELKEAEDQLGGDDEREPGPRPPERPLRLWRPR